MGINLPKNYRSSFSGPCLADLDRSAKLRQLVERVKPRDTSYSQKLVDGHVTSPNPTAGAPAAVTSVTASFVAIGQAMPMQRPAS